MKILRLLDDNKLASVITHDGEIFIFARGQRQFIEASKLLSFDYPITKTDESFLEHVGKRAKEYAYGVELDGN